MKALSAEAKAYHFLEGSLTHLTLWGQHLTSHFADTSPCEAVSPSV